MKLRRSWTVRTFSKGLDFFRIVSVLAESEGIVFCFRFIRSHFEGYIQYVTKRMFIMQVIILIFTLSAGIMLLSRFGLMLLV